jgi:hypothetical protein
MYPQIFRAFDNQVDDPDHVISQPSVIGSASYPGKTWRKMILVSPSFLFDLHPTRARHRQFWFPPILSFKKSPIGLFYAHCRRFELEVSERAMLAAAPSVSSFVSIPFNFLEHCGLWLQMHWIHLNWPKCPCETPIIADSTDDNGYRFRFDRICDPENWIQDLETIIVMKSTGRMRCLRFSPWNYGKFFEPRRTRHDYPHPEIQVEKVFYWIQKVVLFLKICCWFNTYSERKGSGEVRPAIAWNSAGSAHCVSLCLCGQRRKTSLGINICIGPIPDCYIHSLRKFTHRVIGEDKLEV